MPTVLGVLHTSRPLDREQRPHYSLVAHVRDVARWEWQCNSSIEVLLSDVNDNPPVFGQKTYELVLPEDTPAGRLVAHVHALDRDLGYSPLEVAVPNNATLVEDFIATLNVP
ncbi:hypothetical protein HPB51_013085 [Rhipicephalus microplus]|uniref:Cadherin domain-containing protein n=1 Tax=Rhipicephalus microplus TaxID=6941 RepID=A0A9J6F2Q4_RHIMP|nr:hypothetical protein HPB51_013085 [Rhipicephalus microplus]